MSLWRVGNWGGNRFGEIIVANEPFDDRIGNCTVNQDVIQLPNGMKLEGVRDTDISNYLAVGTIAIAVEHAGDHFNHYVPVTLTENEELEITMTPFLDLEFGAYSYGQRVDRLETSDVRKIAAGLAIHYTGPVATRILAVPTEAL
jgi:hypothetical protein